MPSANVEGVQRSWAPFESAPALVCESTTVEHAASAQICSVSVPVSVLSESTNVAASDGSELKARPSPGESSVVADGGVVSSVNVWIDDQPDQFPAASCARTRQR